MVRGGGGGEGGRGEGGAGRRGAGGGSKWSRTNVR